MHKKTKRTWATLLAAAITALLLTACGSGSASTSTAAQMTPQTPAQAYADESYGYEPGESPAEAGMAAGGVVDSAMTLPQDGRKVVMTSSLQMQTLDFDETAAHIRQVAQRYNGYVSDSYVGNHGGYGGRYASYTLRVPAQSYPDFLAGLQQAGNTTELTESSEDITSRYVDVESRLVSLRTQEERMLYLMEQAKDLEDLLYIERKLAEVQYEIEYYTGNLRSMDDRASYSTVNVYLNEVIEFTEPEEEPETYLGRLGEAFTGGWKRFASVLGDISVGLVAAMPVLLLVAVPGVAALLVWRHKKCRVAKGPRPRQADAVPPQNGQGPGAPA